MDIYDEILTLIKQGKTLHIEVDDSKIKNIGQQRIRIITSSTCEYNLLSYRGKNAGFDESCFMSDMDSENYNPENIVNAMRAYDVANGLVIYSMKVID